MAARGVVGPLQLFREHLLARYVLSSPCRPAVNSLSLPRWGETPPLATRKQGLALLQLSCFFNFSTGEVVLMKYKIFSQNKTSRN